MVPTQAGGLGDVPLQEIFDSVDISHAPLAELVVADRGADHHDAEIVTLSPRWKGRQQALSDTPYIGCQLKRSGPGELMGPEGQAL